MNRDLERPGRRTRLFQILVPLMAFALTLAAIELGLRAFHPVPYSIETSMYFESDPHTGFRLKPKQSSHYRMGIPATTNSHGHRDAEMPLAKPPGVFRILVLGDSFTIGSNVRQEEAYPKVLERGLRTKYGPHIQVVNAGVGGWDPFQYAQYFEHHGRRFEPDLILVGFFVGNDTFDPNTDAGRLPTAIEGRRVGRNAWLARVRVFLYNRSNLARLLLSQAPVDPRTFIRRRCDEFTDQHLAIQRARMPIHRRDSSGQRDRARNAVSQIGRIRDMAGGKPVVVALLPDENQVNRALRSRILSADEIPGYDFGMPQSMLTDMFGEMDLKVIDLLPAFLADPRCLYMNDAHWTPQGQELAASAILERLAPLPAPAGAPE